MLKSKLSCLAVGVCVFALSACAPTKVVTEHLGLLAKSCPQTGSSGRQIASVGKQIGFANLSLQGQVDLCRNPARYLCSVRSFHPDAIEGKSSALECAESPAMGGRVCLGVDRLSFNTREASQSPDTDPTAHLPGGEFNRDEYRCFHRELKDGNEFLALAETDQFGTALQGAQSQCKELVAKLQEP